MRQLVSTGTTTSCGAFSPDGSFIVTGTKDRLVLVWPVPPKEEFDQPLTAEITLAERSLDSDRQVRVWAEFDNSKAKLIPGTTSTMVYYPTK